MKRKLTALMTVILVLSLAVAAIVPALQLSRPWRQRAPGRQRRGMRPGLMRQSPRGRKRPMRQILLLLMWESGNATGSP